LYGKKQLIWAAGTKLPGLIPFKYNIAKKLRNNSKGNGFIQGYYTSLAKVA